MRVLILAGGGGTRLWPLSSEEHPKQFIILPGFTSSLFQITIQRAMLFCESKDLIVVTSSSYKDHVLTQSKEIGVALKKEQIFLESKRLNTLPAILAGLLFAKVGLSEDVLVLPSDHIFGNEASLVDAVTRSNRSIQQYISLFGVTPSSPHIGYGYIKASTPITKGLFRVDLFTEKPTAENAKVFVSKGYLWNSGIFYFNTKLFMELLNYHQPKMLHHFSTNKCVYNAFDTWEKSISIDYGLLESISNIVVSEVNTSWTDIGSFDVLIDLMYKKQKLHSLYQEINGSGSFLISHNYIKVVTIGLENLIIVFDKDELLICRAEKSQLVREIN